MLVEPILRIVDSHRNFYKGSCLGSTSNMNHQGIIVWTYLQTLPPHKFNSLPLKSYLQYRPKRRVVLQPSFFRGYICQASGVLKFVHQQYTLPCRGPTPKNRGFPHPVQGMASAFDTHGHFAVLLGLSFRRNSRTHGQTWWILDEGFSTSVFFVDTFNLWETLVVSPWAWLSRRFFLVLWMIENAHGIPSIS